MNMPTASERTGTPQPAAAGGFGGLARRIAGWTANLLATAIVLVAGLAMGRQVLVWWYEQPPPTLAALDGHLPQEMPQDLRLWTAHGPLSINRIAGDKTAALAAMRRGCASASPGRPKAAIAGPGEQRFVARLAKLVPVEQTKELDLFVPDEQVPMVVAVNRQNRRIASWSFGLEVEQGAWSCYTFCPADALSGPGEGAGVNSRVHPATGEGSKATP